MHPRDQELDGVRAGIAGDPQPDEDPVAEISIEYGQGMDPPFLAEGPLQRHGQDGQDFGRDANLLVGD